MERHELIEHLRWKKFPVLDQGFVALVDVIGDDHAVVEAARTSYGKGTKHVSDDSTLIRYLMRHWHTTPFEMVEIKMLLEMPMDHWRQGVRHRTANINEYSTRYSEAIDKTQVTSPDAWRLQSGRNKQGSAGLLPENIDDPVTFDGSYFSIEEKNLHDFARRVYQERIEAGIAREQARKDLPLSTYTRFFWKFDLHNLFHMLRLRMDSHAQQEIRQYAETIYYEIVVPLFPKCAAAFADYRLNAIQLSSLDIVALKKLLRGHNIGVDMTDLHPEWDDKKKCRERDEFFAKMKILGLHFDNSD